MKEENLAEKIEKLIDRTLEELKEYFGEDLISVVLFGSFARGEAKKESDIDLLIVCRDLPKERMKRQDIFIEIEKNIEKEMKRLHEKGVFPYISPIMKTKEEAKKFSPLYLDMVEDAKILFDRQNFFGEILRNLRYKMKELKSKRIWIGKKWYWDLKPDYKFGEEINIE